MKILYAYDAIARHGGMERVIVDKMNSFSQIEGVDVYLLTTNQAAIPSLLNWHQRFIMRIWVFRRIYNIVIVDYTDCGKATVVTGC